MGTFSTRALTPTVKQDQKNKKQKSKS